MEYALGFPEAYEENPWGERVAKVKGKVFLFSSTFEGRLNLTVKLPESQEMAHALPFASPSGYGLGKHGWVHAQFGPEDEFPLDLLKDWIEESYCAIAP